MRVFTVFEYISVFLLRFLWILLKRGKGRGERENEKWEQNQTLTQALSVTSFPVLYFVPFFHFPIFSFSRTPLPASRLSKFCFLSILTRGNRTLFVFGSWIYWANKLNMFPL